MGATVHKLDRKYQPWVNLSVKSAAKSVNRSILKKSRHLGFDVFIVHSSMPRTLLSLFLLYFIFPTLYFSIFCAVAFITLHLYSTYVSFLYFHFSKISFLSWVVSCISLRQDLSQPVSLLLSVPLYLHFPVSLACGARNWLGATHRLNMELDLQSFFGLHVTWCEQLYSVSETPHPPSSPPRIWTRLRGLYWSAKIDDFSM